MLKKIFLTLIIYFSMNVISKADESIWHFNSSDVNLLHSHPADHHIFYGKDPLQFGDLYLPKDATKPYSVAIIIHGGCWMSNFADLKNTAALADALRDLGIATWNIEYRRIDNKGGGWPGTFKDVALASDHLKNISKKYDLNLNKIIVIGQSAGGHLALWLAARHNLPKTSELYVPNPIRFKGVISMGGVPDLKAFREQGATICGSDVVWNLIGKKDNYKNTSLIELLPLGVSQILIYGEDDQAVSKIFSEKYVKKALESGDNINLITIKFAGHHEYNVPNSVTWPYIHESVKHLL